MSIFDNLSKTVVENTVDEWIIGKNAERNRAIIKRRMIDGVTFERLAEEFDLSVPQIKNIVYKCQKIIFKHI